MLSISCIKLTKAKITEPEKLELIERINSVARAYMHGVVFLVLGLLAQNAAAQSGARGMKSLTDICKDLEVLQISNSRPSFCWIK
ncbi:hypothetical protein Psfp_03049 [Pelotomaculum sp. FP]|uniref:hypothetical protein n=1 Tax=Pelotomaculum sp. FP TaxID=261474 RepID=UPI0010670B68|nr:hypothetical protein [Pelotomaculum sp. FP]TEB14228.1 hypothetical protein Psfp_03049 [Pelotomaculum sp. FP]